MIFYAKDVYYILWEKERDEERKREMKRERERWRENVFKNCMIDEL